MSSVMEDATPPSAATTPGSEEDEAVAVVDNGEDDRMEIDAEEKTTTKKKGKTTKKTLAGAGVARTQEEEHAVAGFEHKTRREQIYHRPDMYIGPAERSVLQRVRIYDPVQERMVVRDVDMSPGFVQVFLELLTNALDQLYKARDLSTIKVWIDRDTWTVTVENDTCIPVIQKLVKFENEADAFEGTPVKKKAKSSEAAGAKKAAKKGAEALMWLPTMCFNLFASGDNFDDSKKKMSGGKNGFGSKLANLFSHEFDVQVDDAKRGRRFRQTTTGNLKSVGKPTVRSYSGAKSCVRITAKLDHERFGYTETRMPDDLYGMFVTRVYDLTGCKPKDVHVYLDGKRLPVRDLDDYASLVFGGEKKALARFRITQMVKYEREIKEYDDEGNFVRTSSEKAEAPRFEVVVAPRTLPLTPEELAAAAAGGADSTFAVPADAPAGVVDDESYPVVVGFVNGIPCDEGTHVALALDKVAAAALDYFRDSKSKKDAVEVGNVGGALSAAAAAGGVETFCDYTKVKPQMIKDHVRIIVKVLVDNPTFDSQVKDTLKTERSKWGFTPQIDTTEVALQMQKIGVLKLAMADAAGVAHRSASRALAKQVTSLGDPAGTGRLLERKPQVEKYEHAEKAGQKGEHAVLILTEGDSAKALAMEGLRVVGRDRYGVFPLKGKLLNIRNTPMDKWQENEEFKNLCFILGFRAGVKTPRDLRYQQVFVMSDQDPDGGHIAGLVFNDLQRLMPQVVEAEPTFLARFATPILYLHLRKKSDAKRLGLVDELMFLTEAEYTKWAETGAIPKVNAGPGVPRKDALGDNRTGRLAAYEHKYLKGLGSSSNQMAKRYFQHLDRHVVCIDCRGEENLRCMNEYFSKDSKEERKRIVQMFDPTKSIDYSRGSVQLHEWAPVEVAQFGLEQNQRAIADGIMGLTRARAQILCALMQRRGSPYKSDKVARLAGFVATAVGYHHGEVSLQSSIVGMSQFFVGTNNVHLLHPEGQVGSLLNGPSVFASPRYISAALEPIARTIFPVEDDPVLVTQHEEGHVIEPERYVPIFAYILANGTTGVGWGFAGDVPCYHPREVVEETRRQAEEYDRYVKQFAPPPVSSLGGDGGGGDATAVRVFSLGTLDPTGQGRGRGQGYVPADKQWSAIHSRHDGSMWVSWSPTSLSLDAANEDGGAAAADAAPWYTKRRMHPWYDQFQGTIVADPTSVGTYVVSGRWERSASGDEVHVTALPIGTWKVPWYTKVQAALASVDSAAVAAAKKRKRGGGGDGDEGGNDNNDKDDDDQDKGAAAGKKGAANKGKGGKGAGKGNKSGGDEASGAAKPFIVHDVDRTTTAEVNVRFQCDPDQLAALDDAALGRTLKLVDTINTNNMVLYDSHGRFKRYETAEDIIRDHVPIRYYYYELRRDYQLQALREKIARLTNRKRFLEEYMNDVIIVQKRSHVDVARQLSERGYTPSGEFQKPWFHPDLSDYERTLLLTDMVTQKAAVSRNGSGKGKKKGGVEDDGDDDDATVSGGDDEDDATRSDVDDDAADGGEAADAASVADDGENTAAVAAAANNDGVEIRHAESYDGYEYLVKQEIASLTTTRYNKLCAELQRAQSEYTQLASVSVLTLWMRDLDRFLAEYEQRFLRRKDKLRATDEADDGGHAGGGKKAGGRARKGGKKAAAGAKR